MKMSLFRHPIGHRIAPPALVLAALVALGSGAAQSAPQALALVATAGTVGLACEGRDCSAEMTSFCLDAGRFAPPQGTAYRLAGSGLIRLIATTEDGRALALDARALLRFESARRHLAVRVSVDRAALAELGVTQAEIEIAENVALLPVPRPGDPDPITETEAALLTGPLRHVGSLVVDGNAERMQAARVTSRMINLLPPRGGAGSAMSEVGAGDVAAGDVAAGEALWRRATAASSVDSLSPAARTRARGAFELCRFVGTVGGPSSLRRCLQEQHDGFVDFLNSKFWEAVKTGT
jgi:hypothetical protein